MGGLPRRYSKIKEIRATGKDPLLVDAGDFFFSTPQIDLSNKQSEKFRAEYILEGFETIGYDVLNVGHYELLAGLPFLKKMSKKANIPFISANIKDLNSKELIFKPYQIIEKNGLKIGVIGLTNKLPDSSKSMIADDYIKAGLEYVKEVSLKSDLIVLLVNADRSSQSSLVDTFPDVDFIVTSGSTNMSRKNSPQKEGGPYFYSCGKQGKYLLSVDMNVQNIKKPIVDISNHKNNLKSINKRFERLQKKDPEKTLEEIYQDQSNVLSLIQKYRIELEDSKKAIASAVNTVEYNTIGLNRKIEDDKEMLAFVDKALVKCNAYAPKMDKKQKSQNKSRGVKNTRSKIDHSGHNH
jgi:2',3'-cyclic-nucleotide 2'-phosphodiesterase (5'-nucleotidase family)